jgi:5-methylcytosine-specific restriction protein A
MPRKPPVFSMRPRPPRPDARPSAHRRGYDAAWQRLRLVILGEEPLCRPCRQAGRTTAAEHVDHDVPLSKGGTNDPANLVPMCQPCHSAKTAAQDGGFGHRPTR